MYCYGNFRRERERCGCCELAEYCKEAKDPALLTDRYSSYNDCIAVSKSEITPRTYHTNSDAPAKRIYTHNDLLELITVIVGMDDLTIDYLQMFLSDPSITFQAMSAKKGVSRQAVHKYLKKQCNRIPELNALLKIGDRRKQRIRKSSFLDAVRRIQNKSKLKRQSELSAPTLYWGRLISSCGEKVFLNSNRLKGSRLWKAEQ